MFDSHEAAKAWKIQLGSKPILWLAVLVYGCCVGACVVVVLAFVRRWAEVPPNVYGVLVGGITGCSGLAAVSWFWRRPFRRFLRERLLTPGVPVCSKCVYDLRD